MRVIIQRVLNASVSVEQKIVSSICRGVVVFVGFTNTDNHSIIERMADRVLKLKIFSDDTKNCAKSVESINGDILSVSQITLYCYIKKNKLDFHRCCEKEHANSLYQHWLDVLRKRYNGKVADGMFGELMQVKLVNDGPVTIELDSEQSKQQVSDNNTGDGS
ncbi:hypothetical protein GJ496_005256 [Pomphorhynchus laevis]|nr:hypothetical protein GJ496_005256 [Pomphorhynchus laevis]